MNIVVAVFSWSIAQLVERRTVNSDVPGSRPGGSANNLGGLTR